MPQQQNTHLNIHRDNAYLLKLASRMVDASPITIPKAERLPVNLLGILTERNHGQSLVFADCNNERVLRIKAGGAYIQRLIDKHTDSGNALFIGESGFLSLWPLRFEPLVGGEFFPDNEDFLKLRFSS